MKTCLSYDTNMLDVMRKSLNIFDPYSKEMVSNEFGRFNFFFYKFVTSLVKRYPELLHQRVEIKTIRWELSKLYHLNKQESKLFMRCLVDSEYGIFLDINRLGIKLSKEVIEI